MTYFLIAGGLAFAVYTILAFIDLWKTDDYFPFLNDDEEEHDEN